VSTPSVGGDVFSGLFAPNGLFAVVTEITGATTSAVTSLAPNAGGSFAPVSDSSSNVSTEGAAACWNVFTPNGDFMYVSNAGSSTIAGFSINATSGELTALSPTVVGEASNGGNLDIAVTSDGKFLYSIDSGSGAISGFGIGSDGLLTPATTEISGLPQSAGFQGIAAY
jgi:6-phosphogluconolactonase